MAVRDNERKRGGDEPRTLERFAVSRLVAPLDVESLGAVGERIQRRTNGFLPRKPECQLRVVDDPLDARPAAAPLQAALLVAHAEARRPLGDQCSIRG